MIGQISNEQLIEEYPDAMIYLGMNGDRMYAFTEEENLFLPVMITEKYWVQHNDTSWTNFKTSIQ